MVKYYLAYGYNTENWSECELTKVMEFLFNTLEGIDKFTSKFDSMESLKRELLRLNLIDSLGVDIIIATNKKDKKDNKYKLRKIYNTELLFKKDLSIFGVDTFTSYSECAKLIEKYIKEKVFDINFLASILYDYIEKYNLDGIDAERKEAKSPIVTDGTLKYLKKCIDKGVLPENNTYLTRYYNLFFNELYKCKVIFDENDIRKHIPNRSEINNKGLHDLLIHIINYENSISLTNDKINVKDEIDEYDKEEFPEERDYDYLLKEYALQKGINENNLEEDDFVRVTKESKSLVKKGDGIE